MIGHQTLELGVLLAQLPQLSHLQRPEVRVALLPHVERRFADAHLSAHIVHWLARFRMLQGKQDLLFAMSRSLHRFGSWSFQGLRSHVTPVLNGYEKPK